ncbi:MAG: DMT family transporter [Anaerolineales bacterium]|nr:DMT family transporter [Anaerolineales bacterium]
MSALPEQHPPLEGDPPAMTESPPGAKEAPRHSKTVSERKPIDKARRTGILAALASAFFLGLAPVFGRQAILLGLSPLAVVAWRTALASLLLLALMFFFYRPFLYIYPAGLLGCLLAGWINGLGSLFYYSALSNIGAGVGQLLYSLYPLFLLLWLALDHQPTTRLTMIRLSLALPAIVLLAMGRISAEQNSAGPDQTAYIIGIVEMLISAALYALHLPINQRVLLDMPPPTVTLYTLFAMSMVVVPTYIFSGSFNLGQMVTPGTLTAGSTSTQLPIWPVLGLTMVTFLSRLTLFTGVKHLGGMQTALLGLSELLVTVFFAYLWLGERFTAAQWGGAILLVVSLGLVGLEKKPPSKTSTGGFLSWLRPAGLPTDGWQPHD